MRAIFLDDEDSCWEESLLSGRIKRAAATASRDRRRLRKNMRARDCVRELLLAAVSTAYTCAY